MTFSGEADDKYLVAEHGPRRLADEVEAAYATWQSAGEPPFDQYTVSVDAIGQHITTGA